MASIVITIATTPPEQTDSCFCYGAHAVPSTAATMPAATTSTTVAATPTTPPTTTKLRGSTAGVQFWWKATLAHATTKSTNLCHKRPPAKPPATAPPTTTKFRGSTTEDRTPYFGYGVEP